MNSGTRAFTDKEILDVLKVLKRPRDRCLFMLGLKTGFRISELLSIKIADITEYDGSLKSSITVFKSHTKGKVASRNIPINNESIKTLYEYMSGLNEQQEYLFESQKGTKLSRIQAWRIIKEASHILNLKGKIATHSLRKSFAVRVYEKLNKDLVKTQAAMGHSSINSTVKYLNVNAQEIEQAILDL